jgi:putative NADH-flavin reductase
MNLLIFGATGGTGRELVEQALADGHVVTAFARNPARVRTTHNNLRIVKGDILQYDSVEMALGGQDAVLSTLGIRIKIIPIIAIVIICQIIARLAGLTGLVGWLVRIGGPLIAIQILYTWNTSLSEGTKNIVRAMEKLGVKRFVCESSLGIGDSKGKLGLLYNVVLIPLLLRSVFADKEIQEKAIKESNLDWIIVRPGRLTNGPKIGTYRHGHDIGSKLISVSISREDVADFMLKQAKEDSYLRETPGVAY